MSEILMVWDKPEVSMWEVDDIFGDYIICDKTADGSKFVLIKRGLDSLDGIMLADGRELEEYCVYKCDTDTVGIILVEVDKFGLYVYEQYGESSTLEDGLGNLIDIPGNTVVLDDGFGWTAIEYMANEYTSQWIEDVSDFYDYIDELSR